jgi:radical SAM protein with 4Fe4S-binding SPASM domain
MPYQLPALAWQWNFLRGYFVGNFAYAMPYAVGVDVTNRCNLQCLKCPWHSPESPNCLSGSIHSAEDFDWDLFDSLCEELQTLGTRKLILIGKGEPMLHRQLADMIQRGKKAGLIIRLLTNGTLVDQNWAEFFVRSGLDELQVSLWAANENEYAHNYQGTDLRFFHKVIGGLSLVSEARKQAGKAYPKLVLHRPIEKRFFRNLPQMLEIAQKTGTDALSFSPMKPMGQNIEAQELSPAEETELADILNEMARKARGLKIQTNRVETLLRYSIGKKVWEKHPCFIGWVDARIRVNGDVNPCNTCYILIGNIRESRLREIWNSSACQEFRKIGRDRRTNHQLTASCFCEFCCHVLTNRKIDRILRRLPDFYSHQNKVSP